jgi:hypothetical protein
VETTVQLDDLKARIADRSLGIPRRFASAERTRPEEGIARALEHLERAVVGANVFPEVELTAGHKHSVELSKRSGGVGHAAEEPHDDGGIESAVFRRQSGGIAVQDVDRNPRRVCTLCCGRPGRGIRLDGQHMLDLRRVVLERAAVAAADLDHPPAQSGERLPTEVARNGVGPAHLSPLEVAREARLLGPVKGDRYPPLRSISSIR